MDRQKPTVPDLMAALEASVASAKADRLRRAAERENPNCECDYCAARPLGDT